MRRWFSSACGAALLAFVAVPAQAVSIWLTPASQTVQLGDPVALDVNMDFSADPTVGGGFDVFFDHNMLSFSSFAIDTTLVLDPVFTNVTPDVSTTDQLAGFSFGNFGGLSGPAKVGTLTFQALAPGLTNLSLADNVAPYGPFYSAVTSLQQTVDYTGASVDIAAVPLPPAAWLMLSVLGMFGVVSRRRVDKGVQSQA